MCPYGSCGTSTGSRAASAGEEEPVTTQPSGEEPPRPPQSRQPWNAPRPPSAPPPSGPPSGPLSGGGGRQGGPPPSSPSGPPAGPPSGAGAPPPKGPWWRSVPRLATAVVAVAAVAALVVVLTRPGGTPSGKAGGEVFLQPASATGPDPFTESTAADQGTPPPRSPSTQAPSAAATGAATTGTTVTRSVSGAAPGLYGGTKDVASCDVEKQIKALSAQPAKNAAFASALAVEPASVPGYLRSLTPLQLGVDTRVTNHGYRDGKPIAYQAVLQAGTAVLVDDRGVPRVRCACGNPLAPPVALKGGEPKRTGQPWPSYRPSRVVVIAPSVTVVNKFVIYDHHDGRWVERDRHDHQGKHDKTVAPPVVEEPPSGSKPPTLSPPQSPPTSPPGSPASPPESPLSPPESTPSPPPESPGTSSAPAPGLVRPEPHTSHPTASTATASAETPSTATPSMATPSTGTPSHAAPAEPAHPAPPSADAFDPSTPATSGNT
ncbi:DUF6777 domain-containing protein [Streptomyces sp. NPDC046557]|uniref:DUF6777 domain-containing protein n=1 Tax=Streptomyces sp. NPDC046557 TaxID=3155372 RepID=UPI00340306CF